MDIYQKITIRNKPVYITEKHHHNLLPWSIVRQNQSEGLVVISLDHHTDTNEPFRHFAFDYSIGEFDAQKAQIELNKMNYKNLDSIIDGITKLKNDEHIETAVSLDIIDKCFRECK